MTALRTRLERMKRALHLVFFFQAEDGIRDVAVTGVQTCALPISPWERCRTHSQTVDGGRSLEDVVLTKKSAAGGSCGHVDSPLRRKLLAQSRIARNRSEERRVGKECRSRWSPDH